MISGVGDEPFISTATNIAPRIIKSGNSQISFFMVYDNKKVVVGNRVVTCGNLFLGQGLTDIAA